jgi:hypothetical protein
VILRCRWLYSLFVAIDANFRLKLKTRGITDPELGSGLAYFVNVEKFNAHLKRLSRMRDIVAKITQVIQDIGLICSNKSTKAANRYYKTKQEQKGLRHKYSPEETGNDERSDEGCVCSEGSTSTPELPDPANTPCIPTHHETNCHASPASRPSTPGSLMRTHNGPGDPLLPPSTSFELDVTCRRDDSVDQYESSDSCDFSSSGSSPPSDASEQDSKEGTEEEGLPDCEGGGGTMGE